MNKKFVSAFFIISFLLLAGCRSGPVLNIEQASIVSSVDNVTETQVARAIKRAGASLGWVMKDEGTGEMTGTLLLRKHVAVVSIKFNTQFYSIRYKDSKELGYDGANIHSNYNGWIQNLNNNIQTQLNLL